MMTMNKMGFLALLKHDVSHAAKLLWLLLVLDDAVVSREGAARLLGLSVRQAERAAAELVSVGLLEVTDGWRVGSYSMRRVWVPKTPAPQQEKQAPAQQVDIFDVIAAAAHEDEREREGDVVPVGKRMTTVESAAFRRDCPYCGEESGNFCVVDVDGTELFHKARLSMGAALARNDKNDADVGHVVVEPPEPAANEPTAEDRRAAKRWGGQ